MSRIYGKEKIRNAATRSIRFADEVLMAPDLWQIGDLLQAALLLSLAMSNVDSKHQWRQSGKTK